MADNSLTGYGPSSSVSGRYSRLCFDGTGRSYEQWEVKFLGYLKLCKLKATILNKETDSSKLPTDFAEKNEECYAELIQFLDETSLSLVMNDAADDGRKALQILRSFYAGTSKPRVISLYTELTSLQLQKSSQNEEDFESVTDYFIRAEKIARDLRQAGEEFSDSLLIAMMLKGLPEDYTPFVTVVTQREDEMSLQKFKVNLKSYEETEKARVRHYGSDNIMKSAFANDSTVKPAIPGSSKFQGKCFSSHSYLSR